MKSKTSFWNKSISRYFLNNIVWLSLIYFIGLLIIQLPTLINESLYIDGMLEMHSTFLGEVYVGDIFNDLSSIQYFFTLIIVTIIAITQFDYKNHEASSDFIHTLPVKRTQILTQGIIIGNGVLFAMTIIVGFIIYLVTLNLAFEITLTQIVQWILYSCFVVFVTYSFTIFVGMFVKRAILQSIFTAAAMLLPFISWLLIQLTATFIFEGVPNFEPFKGMGVIGFFESISFPIHVLETMELGYSISILYWGITAIILIIATYILYNRHHVERVSESFYYKWLHRLFTAWLSTLGMLVFGMAVLFIFNNLIVTAFSFAVGLALSYLIVEMILQFTPRIKISIKSIVTTVVFALIFWVLFIFGWHIYLSGSPDRDDISGAYMHNGGYFLNQVQTLKDAGIVDEEFALITSDSEIDYIYEKHMDILEKRSHIGGFFHNPMSYREIINEITITYQLENGDLWHRVFYLGEEDEVIFQEIMDKYDTSSLDILNAVIKPEAIIETNIHTFLDTIYLSEARSAEFLNEYQDHMSESNNMALVNIQNGTKPHMMSEILFEVDGLSYWMDGYHGGYSNIYNPAVIEVLQEQAEATETSISEMIGLMSAELVYLVDVDGQLDEFVDATQTKTFGDLMSEFDFEELDNDDFELIYEQVNEGAFDGNSDTLLVYSESHHNQLSADEFEKTLFTHTSFVVLGIEE